MDKLISIKTGLEAEEKRLENGLKRVRLALAAVNGLGRMGRRGKRKMSAAARARIAAAQRARWAKWKRAQKKAA